MGKKKSRKKGDFKFEFMPQENEGSVLAGAKPLAIIKFIFGIALLPLVYALSASFLGELSQIDYYSQVYFWSGTAALLAIYLFIWDPEEIYLSGQRMLESAFGSFKPLVKAAPYLFPVYLILAAVLYGIIFLWSRSADFKRLFIFIFGFSIALHLVFSAKALRSREGDFLKGNYIFGFSTLYILNLAMLSFLFSLLFGKFSFVNFCNSSYRSAGYIINRLLSQLFIN